MKHIKKFNEASFDRIEEFIKMADKIINLDKLSNTDILSELGDLCNELTFTSEELQKVIDSGRISDPNNFLEKMIEEIIEEEEYLENGYKLNDKQVDLYVKIKSLLDREYSDLSKEEVSQAFHYLLTDKIFNSKIFR
jgi:MoaA/NifB/PqqE/SkfB family radical SAM enzyme